MANVAILPYYDNMAISHIAIMQVIWPIWVSTEQAIEIWSSGGKRNRYKHAIKSYSENCFVSKNPLYFRQNPFIKQNLMATGHMCRSNPETFFGGSLGIYTALDKLPNENSKLLNIPDTLLEVPRNFRANVLPHFL
jgi:hypothetical protein